MPSDFKPMLSVGSGVYEIRLHVLREWRVMYAQAETAKLLGIEQSRASDLLRGKRDKFSLDMLITLATRAGCQVALTIA
jgi:predicted XRE-type DNA-binding protein